jgi:hypothetical protein
MLYFKDAVKRVKVESLVNGVSTAKVRDHHDER